MGNQEFCCEVNRFKSMGNQFSFKLVSGMLSHKQKAEPCIVYFRVNFTKQLAGHLSAVGICAGVQKDDFNWGVQLDNSNNEHIDNGRGWCICLVVFTD